MKGHTLGAAILTNTETHFMIMECLRTRVHIVTQATKTVQQHFNCRIQYTSL